MAASLSTAVAALRVAPAAQRRAPRTARASAPRSSRAPVVCDAQRRPQPGSGEEREESEEADAQAVQPASVVGALAAAMLLVRARPRLQRSCKAEARPQRAVCWARGVTWALRLVRNASCHSLAATPGGRCTRAPACAAAPARLRHGQPHAPAPPCCASQSRRANNARGP